MLKPHALRGRQPELRLAATTQEGCLDGEERVAGAGGSRNLGFRDRRRPPWVEVCPSHRGEVVTDGGGNARRTVSGSAVVRPAALRRGRASRAAPGLGTYPPSG